MWGFVCSAFVLLAAAAASAAPTARFTATKLQGATCVAPCAVHFDAIGNGTSASVDPAYARPFHALLFEWSFGDAAAGTWPTTGQSRNRAIGAIAGHLFETPGTYPVTLTVSNPLGQSSTATSQVVVADPNAAFATSTVCIANSGTPGGAGFAACPVRSASQHRVIAATASGGFQSALSACGATSRKVRCLFRAGDTFRASSLASLGAGSGPGLVSRFGSGANPRVTGGNGFLGLRNGWTVAHFDVDLAGTSPLFRAYTAESGITVADVRGRGAGSCFTTETGSSATHGARIGVFTVDCAQRSDATATAVFLRAERALVMGSRIDNAYGGQFNLRTVHFPRSLIAHSVFLRPQETGSNKRNNVQLRAWAGGNGSGGGGLLPAPSKTEWVIVADNVLGSDNADHFVRTCQSNDCIDIASSQSIENVIFERNFLFRSRGGTGGTSRVARAFWLQGGDITVRNNALDLQGLAVAAVSSPDALVEHMASATKAPALNDDRIHVLANTVYYDDASPNAFQLCRGGAAGTGHLCRNNLAWLPGQSGQRRIDDGGGWSSANNLYAGPNPFAAAVPQQGLSSLASFALDPRGPAADAGYDFVATDAAVRLDAANRCRPADGADADAIAHWDVGAYEASSGTTCRRIP
jgi:PKD repeat protein